MLSRKIVSLAVVVFSLLLWGSWAFADGAELMVSSDSLIFRQTGSTPPPSQQVMVSAKNGTLGAFTALAVTTFGGNWLSVSPTIGSGTTTLTVSVNTTGLVAGEFFGSILVTAPGLEESPRRVKVELRVQPEGTGVLVVRPDELEFHVVAGGPAPQPKQVQIFNTATASFNWSLAASVLTPAGGNWLKVSPTSGTGNAVVQVSVDPTGLGKGEFKGQLTVTSGSAQARMEVELEVEAPRPAKLRLEPRALNFIVEPNDKQPPAAKKLRVEIEGGSTLSWTASAVVNTPPGGKWLSINPTSGSGEAKITASVDITGLAEGMYSGKVVVTSGSESAETMVFLRILGPGKPKVHVTPKALHFVVAGGVVSPSSRTLRIESKATGLSFTATATTAKGGAWLKISPSSGSVPGSLNVSVDTAVALTLAVGVYTGNIEVKVPGAAQEVHNVIVALKVGGAGEPIRLEVEPAGLAFVAKAGGPNPAPKKVKLEAEGAASLSWTATLSTSSGGNWLSVTPASGSAPGEVNVSANIAGLASGVYAGSIVFTPAAAGGAMAVTVQVALVVTASTASSLPDLTSLTLSESVSSTVSAELAAGPVVALFTEPALGFMSQVDLPLNVSVLLLDATGAAVEGATVTIRSSNGEPDLVLTDLGGGQYTGVFRAMFSGPLTLTGSVDAGLATTLNFAVSGDMEPATPTLIFQGGAVSAASFAVSPTPLASGSLMSVFGLGIAGNGGAAARVPLPRSLGGVSVTIGGVPAPLLVAAAGAQDQINLQIPFELEGVAQADVVVNNNGVLSTAETISLGPAVPALFTFSQTGAGAGAILHANFSAVNSGSPAAAGEVVLLYATGLGAVSPPVSTGAAATALAKVTGNVQVTFGGVPAEVQFAGLAPGFVGLYQINVKVPAGVASGDALVVVSVGGTPATGRATIAMR